MKLKSSMINMDSSCSDVTYQDVPFYLGYLQGLFETLWDGHDIVFGQGIQELTKQNLWKTVSNTLNHLSLVLPISIFDLRLTSLPIGLLHLIVLK